MLMLALSASLLFALAQAATAPEHPAVAAPSSPVAPPANPGDLSTPADPEERIELGREVNGLQGLDLGPWHLKASYEVFGADGKSKDKGTFEEWRINAKQYKLAYHSPELSLEEYGTPRGVFRTGGQDWPSRPIGMLPRTIMQPIPSRPNSKKTKLKNYERNVGTLKLQCTAFVDHGGSEFAENSDCYCFAPTNAVLLYSTNPHKVFQTLFEHVSLVHGHYVGRDIELFLLGKRWLSIHIDTLDSLGPSALPDLSVPDSAMPVSRRADGSGVVSGGPAIEKAAPEYPLLAKAQRVEGVVVLGATIGTDGHIKNLEVLAGPPLLQKPAMDAAQQWVYNPFFMDGEPVEVEIELNVEFHLSGG